MFVSDDAIGVQRLPRRRGLGQHDQPLDFRSNAKVSELGACVKLGSAR